VALIPQSVAAQEVDTVPAVTWGQAGSFAVAGAAYGVSQVLDINSGPPDCAPCDPQSVPGFDRWAIRPPVAGFSTASDVLILGLGTATLAHTGTRTDGLRRMVVGLETVAWTLAVSELSKAVIGRYRPVMYTEEAEAAADAITSQRSMPSGHTANAFALATAYWLNNPDVGLAPKFVAMAGAVAVGALRVAAAKHFPSDVLAGAVLGSGVALAVHHIRF
jgi:undecaprenyl-diphosphatase